MTPEPNNQFNPGIPGKEKPKTEEPKTEEPKDYPVFKGSVNGKAPKNIKHTGSIKATCGRCHYNFEQLLCDELIICPKCQNKGAL